MSDSASNPSCVIVGNGGSLACSGLGPFIDSHDIIIRFNAFELKGHETDVGTKATHWFTVMHPRRDWRNGLPWTEIWTHSWERLPSRCQTFQRHREIQRCPVQKVPHTFLDEMSSAANTPYRSWSTGALAVWGMLAYARLECVNLAGFDWWREPTPPHHYSDTVPRGTLHQPAEEWKLMNALLKQGRIKLHG